MPPPRLNPARQLPTPLPILGSAPGMWEQPRRASSLLPSSQSSTHDLAKGAPNTVTLKHLPGAQRLRRRKVRCPCMPMARWVFGTSCSRLPGLLGTAPARRHAVHPHPWWPARPGAAQGTAPVPPALPAAAPGPSPLAAPWGLAATPRCFTLRHAREPGKLAGR